MKITDIYRLADKFAPFEFSENYCEKTGACDNSGIIVDNKDEIKGICFALDLTKRSLFYAVENGCNLIITHHPAIFSPVKCVDGNVYDAARAGVGVISCHLDLDFAKDGVDACFARALGAKKTSVVDKSDGFGYGRVFSFDGTFAEFKDLAEKRLDTTVFAFGESDKKIKTVASFCGAGLDENAIDAADADVYCSADIKHHVLCYALDRDKCVLQFTHYASEIMGIKNFYEYFSGLTEIKKQNIKLCFFDDGKFFPLSEKE